MKYLLLTVAFFVYAILLPPMGSCQVNFIPGYLVDINGDTLHGFIDYRARDVNPDQIYFKTSLNNIPAVYYPISIKGFAIQNEIYESAVVIVDKNPVKTEEISYSAEFDPRKDTVFLQTLIQGIKSLYYYFDTFGKEHFFIKRGIEFELLVFQRYKVMKDDAIGVAYNRKYLQQLSDYFQDCQGVLALLEDIEYNKKSLINLFNYYYNCVHTDIEFQRGKDRFTTEFGLLAGPSFTKLNFISISFPYIAKVDYPLSPYFSGGLFLNIILPGHQGKYSFNNELFFTSYKVKGRYDEYVSEDEYTTTFTTLGYSYVKMNNMFRIKYPVRNLFCYFNAGISNGFAVQETNYMKKILKFYTMDRTTEGKAIPSTQKYEQGYVLGLGTRLKDVSFEFRYERANGMSKHANLRSNTTRLYFLFGYKF